MRNGLLFLFLFSLAIHPIKGQTDEPKPSNFFMGHLGGGTSSIEGWSVVCAFSYERKNNEFTIRGIYNNQIGHRQVDFLGFDYYNDRFANAAVLYGRTYRKKIFFASVSVGPSLYKYTDKFLVRDTITNNWLNNDYAVNQKQCSGIGFACEVKLIALFTEEVGVSALFWSDINNCKSISGVSLALTFGILRD